MSPALAVGFLTTVPPGKPSSGSFKLLFSGHIISLFISSFGRVFSLTIVLFLIDFSRSLNRAFYDDCSNIRKYELDYNPERWLGTAYFV